MPAQVMTEYPIVINASWAGIARPSKTSSIHAKAPKSTTAGHAPSGRGYASRDAAPGPPSTERSTNAKSALQGFTIFHTSPTSAER